MGKPLIRIRDYHRKKGRHRTEQQSRKKFGYQRTDFYQIVRRHIKGVNHIDDNSGSRQKEENKEKKKIYTKSFQVPNARFHVQVLPVNIGRCRSSVHQPTSMRGRSETGEDIFNLFARRQSHERDSERRIQRGRFHSFRLAGQFFFFGRVILNPVDFLAAQRNSNFDILSGPPAIDFAKTFRLRSQLSFLVDLHQVSSVVSELNVENADLGKQRLEIVLEDGNVAISFRDIGYYESASRVVGQRFAGAAPPHQQNADRQVQEAENRVHPQPRGLRLQIADRRVSEGLAVSLELAVEVDRQDHADAYRGHEAGQQDQVVLEGQVMTRVRAALGGDLLHPQGQHGRDPAAVPAVLRSIRIFASPGLGLNSVLGLGSAVEHLRPPVPVHEGQSSVVPGAPSQDGEQ